MTIATSKAPILTLPAELLAHIGDFLPREDFKRCVQSCKTIWEACLKKEGIDTFSKKLLDNDREVCGLLSLRNRYAPGEKNTPLLIGNERYICQIATRKIKGASKEEDVERIDGIKNEVNSFLIKRGSVS